MERNDFVISCQVTFPFFDELSVETSYLLTIIGVKLSFRKKKKINGKRYWVHLSVISNAASRNGEGDDCHTHTFSRIIFKLHVDWEQVKIIENNPKLLPLPMH